MNPITRGYQRFTDYTMDNGRQTELADYEWLAESEIELAYIQEP